MEYAVLLVTEVRFNYKEILNALPEFLDFTSRKAWVWLLWSVFCIRYFGLHRSLLCTQVWVVLVVFCWWLVGGGVSPHPQRFKDFSLCKRWPRRDVVLSDFFTFRITSSKFRAPWFGGSKVLALEEADTSLLAYVSLLTFGHLVLNYTRHRNQWMLLFLTACSSIENQELDCWGKSSKSLCGGGCSYQYLP